MIHLSAEAGPVNRRPSNGGVNPVTITWLVNERGQARRVPLASRIVHWVCVQKMPSGTLLLIRHRMTVVTNESTERNYCWRPADVVILSLAVMDLLKFLAAFSFTSSGALTPSC